MARRAARRFRRTFRGRRFHRSHKGKFPIVGAAVATLPLLRAIDMSGGFPGFFSSMVNSPSAVVKQIVKMYTGVDTNTGQIDTNVLMSTAGPIVGYVILKKVAGRRLNSIFRHLGVAF